MSLTKRPTMTPEKIAANQANAHLSNGPATPEGRERIRAAHLKHGFYSLAADEALLALGEDPDDLQALVQGAIDHWRPADDFEARLVKRLARALWRLDRDDRWHDSVAVRQIRRFAYNNGGLIRETEVHCKKKQAALKRLLEAAKKEDFATQLSDFSDFGEVFGEDTSDVPWAIYVLLHRLLKPGTPVEGAVPEGYKGPEAMPNVPIAEDHHRIPIRRELRERLEAAIEALKAERDRRIEELQREGSDPFLRDVLCAPNHAQASLVQRSEDSNFRKVEKLTTLLLKLRKGRTTQNAYIQDEGISRDVDETKGDTGEAEDISHDVDENTWVTS